GADYGPSRARLSRNDHDFSLHVPTGDVSDGLARALKGERPVDTRSQPAVGIPAEQLFQTFIKVRRLVLRERARVGADDGAALQQGQVQGNLRDLAGGETRDDEAAAPGH